jgi:hypothetical protein
MITTPGASPTPATSATSASFTTTTRARALILRMMSSTRVFSSSRSAPAIPRQIAATSRSRSPSAWSITEWSTFSTASSPSVLRLAPPARPSPITVPSSSAR